MMKQFPRTMLAAMGLALIASMAVSAQNSSTVIPHALVASAVDYDFFAPTPIAI